MKRNPWMDAGLLLHMTHGMRVADQAEFKEHQGVHKRRQSTGLQTINDRSADTRLGPSKLSVRISLIMSDPIPEPPRAKPLQKEHKEYRS